MSGGPVERSVDGSWNEQERACRNSVLRAWRWIAYHIAPYVCVPHVCRLPLHRRPGSGVAGWRGGRVIWLLAGRSAATAARANSARMFLFGRLEGSTPTAVAAPAPPPRGSVPSDRLSGKVGRGGGFSKAKRNYCTS